MSQVATTTMRAISCKCGGTYMLSKAYVEEKQYQGGCWTCPYCQTGWGFSGNSGEQKLKDELRSEKAARARETAWNDQEEARLKDLVRRKEGQRRAEKGAKTKAKQRAAAGVCPCCTRSFKQLRAHMKTKHPDYKP